ncbi:MAG TPA: YcnI family protein [Acidimicrobiales bacterium]|nr:YcnI family protein [Acidimicrobiales bacterium]
MKKFLVPVLLAAMALTAVPAAAHVTVQPTEARTNSFSRFVVRVPNERDNAATVKVELQLPDSLVAVSFEPKPGWTRRVERKPLPAPVEVFGEQVTDYVATVTWEGGRIGTGDFEEFGFSARTPQAATTLRFPAVQTYDNGEAVRWIGPAGSEEPAGEVKTFVLPEGDLATLSRLAAERPDADDDSGDAAMSAAALALAVVAVGLSLRRRGA